MLRIKRDGKTVSLKEQEKIVKENPEENPGRPVVFDKPAVKARSKHPGLRPSGGDKKEVKQSAEPKTSQKK